MLLLRGQDRGQLRGKAVCPRCREEAVGAGFYAPPIATGWHYPRVQILTIAELLAGKELEYPKQAPARLKKAPRRYRKPEQEELW